MKTKTVKVYSILWPHSIEPVHSFVEMKDMGCVTVGVQYVELEVHELPESPEVALKRAKIEQLRDQKVAIEQQLRSLEQ